MVLGEPEKQQRVQQLVRPGLRSWRRPFTGGSAFPCEELLSDPAGIGAQQEAEEMREPGAGSPEKAETMRGAGEHCGVSEGQLLGPLRPIRWRAPPECQFFLSWPESMLSLLFGGASLCWLRQVPGGGRQGPMCVWGERRRWALGPSLDLPSGLAGTAAQGSPE